MRKASGAGPGRAEQLQPGQEPGPPSLLASSAWVQPALWAGRHQLLRAEAAAHRCRRRRRRLRSPLTCLLAASAGAPFAWPARGFSDRRAVQPDIGGEVRPCYAAALLPQQHSLRGALGDRRPPSVQRYTCSPPPPPQLPARRVCRRPRPQRARRRRAPLRAAGQGAVLGRDQVVVRRFGDHSAAHVLHDCPAFCSSLGRANGRCDPRVANACRCAAAAAVAAAAAARTPRPH